MRRKIAQLFRYLALKLQPPMRKSWQFPLPQPLFSRPEQPSENELAMELRDTVFTCSSLNASACASFPPRLYLKEGPVRWPVRSIAPWEKSALPPFARNAREVLQHPLLDLLRQVNPVHNSHDLWELTAFDQEITGSAYWLIEGNPPEFIWPLPALSVKPKRGRGSNLPVDYYELRRGGKTERLAPERVIHFRHPDPRDPYGPGLSPLRACFDSVRLASLFLSLKKHLWENRALPGVILSPAEPIHDEERARLEEQWNALFRDGGNGRVLVTETGMKVDVVAAQAGDLAALAEAGATRDTIANAFGIPLAFLTRETNLANLRAAEHQHLAKAIRPRLRRRDEKLNERLLPLFDPQGELFLATPDPVQADRDFLLRQEELDLKYSVRTVAEIRAARGLDPDFSLSEPGASRV